MLAISARTSPGGGDGGVGARRHAEMEPALLGGERSAQTGTGGRDEVGQRQSSDGHHRTVGVDHQVGGCCDGWVGDARRLDGEVEGVFGAAEHRPAGFRRGFYRAEGEEQRQLRVGGPN